MNEMSEKKPFRCTDLVQIQNSAREKQLIWGLNSSGISSKSIGNTWWLWNINYCNFEVSFSTILPEASPKKFKNFALLWYNL